MSDAECDALQKRLVDRWNQLPEGMANAVAGNFFPELLTLAPESVLRAVDVAIANADDVVSVDAGRLSVHDALARQFEREAQLRREAG